MNIKPDLLLKSAGRIALTALSIFVPLLQSIASTETTAQLKSIEASSRGANPVWEPVTKPPANAPNIIIVLFDDTGFADFGAFGSEIETPNIDKLAGNGLRYNNFTVTAVCSPTRAALLTGLNHHSAGMGWLSNMDSGFPGYRGEIRPDVMTLPEILRENGYNTLMAGKWHLSNSTHLSASGPFDSWPLQRGFEQYWGFLDGHINQWTPPYLHSGNRLVDQPLDDDFYFPDEMTRQAIAMLRDQRAASPDKPFFLYFATPATHSPHHTRPEDRARFRGRYKDGYDVIRAQRFERQKQLGIAPENAELTPHYPGVQPWSELGEDERKVFARLQENYAAYVHNADQQVGKLINYLEQVDELDNTLIILTSDNGASVGVGRVGTTMGTRYYSGSVDTTEKNLRDIDKIGGPETTPHYPHGWMQVSNTPFKYSKATTHGGGVRSPLIMHWPKQIKDKGAIRQQFHHVNDIVPTVLDAIGIVPPKTYKGASTKPIEGVSMTYTFEDGSAESQKGDQYYELQASRGYVSDGWKIVTRVKPGERFDSVPWELYKLDNDFSENKDLSTQYPEKVSTLNAKWWEAAKQFNVLPIHDESIAIRGQKAMANSPSTRHKKFTYLPGAETVHNVSAPILPRRNFILTAEIDRASTAEEGVLAAMGGFDGGYAFYIKDNHLYYEVNVAGEHTFIKSSDPLPVGKAIVGAEFRLNGIATEESLPENTPEDQNFVQKVSFAGELTLIINGEPSGSKHFDRPAPHNTWEGLDIGLDRRLSVSKNYQAPFAFTGDLESVTYQFD